MHFSTQAPSSRHFLWQYVCSSSISPKLEVVTSSDEVSISDERKETEANSAIEIKSIFFTNDLHLLLPAVTCRHNVGR